MAIIRREPEQTALSTFDPFRMMKEWLRWDPFREMTPDWYGPNFPEKTFAPAFDVKETKDGFVFKADVPGIKDKDIEVKLTGNRLAISGKREYEHEDKNDTYYAFERTYGTFLRTFTLPDAIDPDHVTAELKEGVLTVGVPKRLTAQTKSVAIKPGDVKS
jgi:HSP20 family protein